MEFESVWEDRQIDFSALIPIGVHVTSDEELLRLVWNNLLSNAFKFTPPGGSVSVDVQQTAKETVVTVADTGCGMTWETGAHIFEKFYQGDTSHKTNGNGLGLALVRRVIDITDSRIEMESEPGVVTTFRVVLRG